MKNRILLLAVATVFFTAIPAGASQASSYNAWRARFKVVLAKAISHEGVLQSAINNGNEQQAFVGFYDLQSDGHVIITLATSPDPVLNAVVRKLGMDTSELGVIGVDTLNGYATSAQLSQAITVLAKQCAVAGSRIKIDNNRWG